MAVIEAPIAPHAEPDLAHTEVATAPPSSRRSTAIALAVLSFGAASLHFAFAPGHFDESSAHGAAFLVMGWAQLVTGLLLLTHPSRRVFAGALVVNLAIAGLWIVSRTVGVPIGPEAGVAEPVGLPDALAATFEAVIVVAMASRLLGVRADLASRMSWLAPAVSVAAIVLVIGATSIALTPRFAGEHHHGGASGEEAAAGHAHDATLAGAGTDAGTDAAAGTAAPGATHDHSAAGSALTGTTPCELSGPAASTAQVTDAEGHDHRGPFPQQPLTFDERQTLKEQQVQARTVADRYPTVAAAEAAGYVMSTPYVPCIGAHYTNTGLVFGFDPASPSELLFDGTQPDSRLVGLSFLIYHPGGPPEGFAGPNDIWHQHNSNGGLCFAAAGTVIGGESMSEADCRSIGGVKRELVDVWMVHDWIVPGWECTWGAFAAECPELGGRIGGTAWDPPAAN